MPALGIPDHLPPRRRGSEHVSAPKGGPGRGRGGGHHRGRAQKLAEREFRPGGGPGGPQIQAPGRAQRLQIQVPEGPKGPEGPEAPNSNGGPGAPIWARTHSPQRLRAPGGRPEFKPIFRPKVWPPEFGPRFATSQVVGSWARSTIRRAGSTQTQIHVFERLPNYKKILEYTGNMWGS